jgi:hypothetical protein
MTNIVQWTVNANDNNSASPNGFPEQMNVAGVNNSAREVMAAIRTMYGSQLDWRPVGKATSAVGDEYTTVFATSTTFTTAAADGDTTAIFVADRRVRAVGTSTGTIYGTISSSVFAGQTTVTVTWDSGSLASDSDLVISLGPIPTGSPISSAAVDGVSAGLAGYAELYVNDNTTTQTLNSTDQLVDFDVASTASSGPVKNATVDTAASTITVNITGVWRVSFVANVTTADSQTADSLQSYDWEIRVNAAVPSHPINCRTETGDSSTAAMAMQPMMTGYLSLTSGDVLSVYASENNAEATMAPALRNGSLIVEFMN